MRTVRKATSSASSGPRGSTCPGACLTRCAEAQDRYRVESTAHSKLAGEIRLLVVSKVANFSIDLPEAIVAIQVSGTFGSRQEEAQRLGRILRPKHDGRKAHFYSVVARDTNDQEFALRRQRFLAEQGYAYRIVDAGEVLVGDLTG